MLIRIFRLLTAFLPKLKLFLICAVFLMEILWSHFILLEELGMIDSDCTWSGGIGVKPGGQYGRLFGESRSCLSLGNS